MLTIVLVPGTRTILWPAFAKNVLAASHWSVDPRYVTSFSRNIASESLSHWPPFASVQKMALHSNRRLNNAWKDNKSWVEINFEIQEKLARKRPKHMGKIKFWTATSTVGDLKTKIQITEPIELQASRHLLFIVVDLQLMISTTKSEVWHLVNHRNKWQGFNIFLNWITIIKFQWVYIHTAN